jgi:8-oxo-dGDP phosphatase
MTTHGFGSCLSTSSPPDGRRFEHHVVRLQTVVLAVVLNDDDRVLMLWRHRFATDEWGWELPGGIAHDDEDPAVTAVQEVVEETGWKPSTLEPLVRFQPMPGMVDTPHVIYLGRNAVKVGVNALLRNGAPPGTRTPNPRIKSPLLCQLS